MTTSANGAEVPLGSPVPPFTPHAVSVSLPTWRDNVGYEEGDKRVIDAMVCGYPRFFINPKITKLAQICEQKFGTQGESSMLFPTKLVAEQCRSFIHHRSSQDGKPVIARLIQLLICPEDKANQGVLVNSDDCGCNASTPLVDLHIALFPSDAFSYAKQFWQHSGGGISSRLAEHCLSLLPENSPPSSPALTHRYVGKVSNRHYSTKEKFASPIHSPPLAPTEPVENLSTDQSFYLEERYGRNLPQTSASFAKRALRRRIAGVLVREGSFDDLSAGDQDAKIGPSRRGVDGVSEHDVYLYPCGMNAIFNAHQLAMSVLPQAKSVCFGFPYTDTLKILQKWGPGCHFLGHGLDSDIDELEKIIKEEIANNPSKTPLLALFTEFPSNPLLRSADLPRLRKLADEHGFLLVVDETIGNFTNVDVLPLADVVVSSLTKVFSGASNVMGGSLVLNPQGKHYSKLKTHLDNNYEDNLFDQDAIFLERNSRDFQRRVKVIDANAEAVCEFLRSQSPTGGSPSGVVKDVYYPKYVTPNHYERCRIKDKASPGENGGFGGLFSVTFTSPAASHAFYDALSCYKGPSLGTNFTLASPYAILAHFTELDWAAQYGVEADLVRVSVGTEDITTLLASFRHALKAAEAATTH
ncbi:PLP-dependent transferase [Dendrothele bispora CBS 962.96]|uniref:cystathionine gamma-synthase n=1 Tax=Dendrothele bispora (strain CBS 962.96) TaxID=1314807 RepID=A0A4S8KYG2_DENBC|nr:PLP-dependent transferase [Dendrothele bispora CBS 962.96]